MRSHLASRERRKALVTCIYSERDMQKIKESIATLSPQALDKGDEQLPCNAMGKGNLKQLLVLLG